ncbi:MAG: DUF2779 domain-containing protein [Candidatus Yonathbacteria bacterium]|nr:DUF2779 domain-containing protein [Candidatus Yonathbacteria bacterium]
MKVTKTDFILYRECPNNVWVKLHQPKEYSKFEISEFEKALGEMGNDVEELARVMFPEGKMVNGRGEEAQKYTQKLIAEKTKVIFQAVFITDKFLVATDVLKWNESADAYDLYEIKMSSTSDEDDEEDGKPKKVSKKKELQYENDIAFQVNVLLMCNVPIRNKYLVRLNKGYVKSGPLAFAPNQLFIIEDKTKEIDNLAPSVLIEMDEASLFLSEKETPTAPCPCHYKGRSSHCTAFTYINPSVPSYSVHDLNRIGNSKKYLKELLDAGILTIDKVPIDDRLQPQKKKEDEEAAKPRKLNQVMMYKSQEPIIDLEAIKAELNSLTFPLYFLDYETFPTAIPIFDGYHPYQHIVFQYSLHVLKDKNAPLEHFELLLLHGDPAERIVKSLRSHIGDTGSIISWYKKFENSRNRELASLVPLQFEFLHSVIDRTYDLMDIVDNQYYVHPGFKGSASIKKVQTVLAPDLSYKKLSVQNGTDAIEAYRQITAGELTGELAEEKKRQMLEYCEYDTKVMYMIWKFFTKLAE